MAYFNSQLHLLAVKHHDKKTFALPEHIIYIKGKDKTVQLFANDPFSGHQCRVYTAAHNLGYYEYLERFGFVRVHQTFIINLNYLNHITNESGILLHSNWQHEAIFLTDNYKVQLKALTQKPVEQAYYGVQA